MAQGPALSGQRRLAEPRVAGEADARTQGISMRRTHVHVSLDPNKVWSEPAFAVLVCLVVVGPPLVVVLRGKHKGKPTIGVPSTKTHPGVFACFAVKVRGLS